MRPDTYRPVLAALLLAASLLAGCAAGEPPASDAASAGIPAADSAVSTPAPGVASAPADDIAPPASAAGETARAAWPVPETGIDFAPIENFATAGVVRAVRDDLRGAATADGFYAVAPQADGSALLTFVDFAAKQHIVLCNQPNCAHNSDACPAWYARDNALRPYAVGGKLAVLQGGSYAGGDAVPQVDCMNADGSGRQTAFVFPASCWVSTLPHYHMAFDDENLYFVVVDSASGERQAILCAAHIPSGQVFALCGLPEDETHLVGGTDGVLVLEYTPGINQSTDAAPADTQVVKLDLAARRAITKLEGREPDDEMIQPYLEYNSPKYLAMVEEIRKELNLHSLKFQKLEKLIEAIGVDPSKVCTYCWNGRDVEMTTETFE